MTDLGAVLEQLKLERNEAESRLRSLNEAIAALGKILEENVQLNPKRQRPYRLSEAARERISTAQKERWAKIRDEPTKSNK
jgi:hypothetical protein